MSDAEFNWHHRDRLARLERENAELRTELAAALAREAALRLNCAEARDAAVSARLERGERTGR